MPPECHFGREIPTGRETHERAAVRILNRVSIVTPNPGDDPELGRHERVIQGALDVARNLNACLTSLAHHLHNIPQGSAPLAGEPEREYTI